MKTIHLDIPTMTRPDMEEEVKYSLQRLDSVSVSTSPGHAAIVCPDHLLRVELIIAVEEAGYVVKY